MKAPELTQAEIAAYYRHVGFDLKPRKGEQRFACPLHGGERDSFSLRLDTGQWRCHSECDRGGDVYEFEMLRSGLAFAESAASVLLIVGGHPEAGKPLASGGAAAPAGKKRSNGGRAGGESRVVAEYSYQDETGTELFQAVRFEPGRKGEPKDFSQRHRGEGGEWVWTLKGVRLVPFHLPELLRSSRESVVLVVEGEKCVYAAESMGFVATCNPMGAGKWRAEYGEYLRGRRVVILPDNDDKGREHARRVFETLGPVAAEARVVVLPGLAEKGDIADWIAGGDRRGELLELIEAAFRKPAVEERPTVSPGEPEFLWNDTGNADRLVYVHGSRLMWCEERETFAVWTGTHWRLDKRIGVEVLAESVIRAAFSEAGRMGDSVRRKAFLSHLDKSLSRAGIANMAWVARRKVRQVLAGEFDANPELLNFENGTVDLRSGTLRAHNPDDLNSKCIPYRFDAKASAPRFFRFLDRIFGGDPDGGVAVNERAEGLISYLQVALGCAATGIPEKAIFILHGEGGDNGKTTLVETIRDVFGPYAGQVQIESLLASARDAAGSNAIWADLADLQGCRFVSASEPEKHSRFSVSRVKYLTGMTQIKARHLRENPFTFEPTHKFFVDCNNRPLISDPHDAVWNRVKPIPFPVRIPKAEIDKALPRKLRRERCGVAAWIVAGAVLYLRDGLKECPDVLEEAKKYRAESDPLLGFLAEKCVVTELRSWGKTADLFESYKQWAGVNGEHPLLNRREFVGLLEKKFPQCRRQDGRVRAFVGIRLKLKQELFESEEELEKAMRRDAD